MKLTDDTKQELKQLAQHTLKRGRVMGINPRTRWVILSPMQLEDTHLQIGNKKLPIIYEPTIEIVNGMTRFYVVRKTDWTKAKRA